MAERKKRYKKTKIKVIKNPITGRTRTITKTGNNKIVKVTGGKKGKGDKTKRKNYSLGLKSKFVDQKGRPGAKTARKAVRKKMKGSTLNIKKRTVIKRRK